VSERPKLLRCYACGVMKPDIDFPVDKRSAKRGNRGIVCNQCKQDRR
jgi:hypothetical protein